MNALVPFTPATLPISVTEAEIEAALRYQSAGKAASTKAAYAADWRAFALWCHQRGHTALPATPQVVAQHVAAIADGWRPPASARQPWRRAAPLSPSSIGRAVAAIAHFHELAGHDSPAAHKAVRAVLSGIRRTKGTAPVRKKAVTADLLTQMLATCDGSMQGRRDRALLTLGFIGAFRRSELVALNLEDLEEVPDGYRVTIRRSKTDQEGQGQEIAIPRGSRLRPVEAVQHWLAAAGITSGPIFVGVHRSGSVQPGRLTAHMVALIVKRRAKAAGLDPVVFAGHSLRAGFCTSAAENGANSFKITEVTRHRSLATLGIYIRHADAFKDHAAAGFA